MNWLAWHVGDVSSLEAMEIFHMNTTFERRHSVDGLTDKKMVKLAPIS